MITKDELKDIIYYHFGEKDVGTGIIHCIHSRDDVDKLVETLVKKLNLARVSQQRELLLAFIEWKFASSYDLSDANYIVDEFEKANNCG